MNAHDRTMLETLIDSSSLKSMLEALQEICHEKEHHILTHWQDKPLATEWRKAATRMRRALRSFEGMHKTPGSKLTETFCCSIAANGRVFMQVRASRLVSPTLAIGSIEIKR